MRYPDTYKSKSGFSITKFEKDKRVKPLEYNFFNIFPVSLSSTPVSYDTGKILKKLYSSGLTLLSFSNMT